jgi:hypothetical protein
VLLGLSCCAADHDARVAAAQAALLLARCGLGGERVSGRSGGEAEAEGEEGTTVDGDARLGVFEGLPVVPGPEADADLRLRAQWRREARAKADEREAYRTRYLRQLLADLGHGLELPKVRAAVHVVGERSWGSGGARAAERRASGRRRACSARVAVGCGLADGRRACPRQGMWRSKADAAAAAQQLTRARVARLLGVRRLHRPAHLTDIRARRLHSDSGAARRMSGAGAGPGPGSARHSPARSMCGSAAPLRGGAERGTFGLGELGGQASAGGGVRTSAPLSLLARDSRASPARLQQSGSLQTVLAASANVDSYG